MQSPRGGRDQGRDARSMRFLRAVFFLAILVAGIALVYIYAGGYDVAATTRHSAAGRWLLATVMRNSVQAGARYLIPPDNFEDPALVAQGGQAYGAMCETCHGGPGAKPAELTGGLRPQPRDLTRTAADWKPRELFWIVKHGIAMTGMPAWGPTHKDAELWSIAAFVRKLPTMTPEQYRALRGSEGPSKGPPSEGPKVSSATPSAEPGNATGAALAPTEPAQSPPAGATPKDQAGDVANAAPTDTANTPPSTDQATGTTPGAPNGEAGDVANAEPGEPTTTPPEAPNGAARDVANAEPAKPVTPPETPSGQARDVANAEPAKPAPAPETPTGQARDLASAEPTKPATPPETPTGQARDVANAAPTGPAEKTTAANQASGRESEAATRSREPPVATASIEEPTPDHAPQANQVVRIGPQPRVKALPQPKPPVPDAGNRVANARETNQAMDTGPRLRVRALPEPKPPVPQAPRRRR